MFSLKGIWTNNREVIFSKRWILWNLERLIAWAKLVNDSDETDPETDNDATGSIADPNDPPGLSSLVKP